MTWQWVGQTIRRDEDHVRGQGDPEHHERTTISF
jgi:hypothetical protein